MKSFNDKVNMNMKNVYVHETIIGLKYFPCKLLMRVLNK
jgi:hypothetical protein